MSSSLRVWNGSLTKDCEEREGGGREGKKEGRRERERETLTKSRSGESYFTHFSIQVEQVEGKNTHLDLDV